MSGVIKFPTGTEHNFRAALESGLARVLWVLSPALPDGDGWQQFG